MAKKINVCFSGQLVAGMDPQQVRENLAKLFKMPVAQTERLFASKNLVLKKDLDEVTAAKYQALLRQAGIVCELQEQSAAVEPDAAAAVAQAPTTVASRPAASAVTGAADDAWSLAPPGTRLLEGAEPQAAAEVVVDDAGLSLAPVGAQVLEAEHRQQAPAFEPDLSDLSLAPLGESLLDKD